MNELILTEFQHNVIMILACFVLYAASQVGRKPDSQHKFWSWTNCFILWLIALGVALASFAEKYQ